MCLSVPMKIKEVKGTKAIVEKDGVTAQADLSLVGDVTQGEFVLVHAGFAIEKWSDKDLEEYNRIVGEG